MKTKNNFPDNWQDYRSILNGQIQRVVVKVGSAVLTKNSGLSPEVMSNLAEELSFLKKSGKEVILISSGAVAAGKKKLSLPEHLGLKEKQAAAAVGQSSLMRAYEDIFAKSDIQVAQILLTHKDLANRDRYLNIRNTLFTLLNWGILPIINENDSVSVKELRFGDNDSLGAMITNLIEADLFLCLTDVDALYTGNPATDLNAHPIRTVLKVDKKVEQMAGNVCGSLGTGGMRSKIMAAKTVSARGGISFIGSGREKMIIQKLFKGEPVGTFFLPLKDKITTRKHWIAYTLRPKGELILDNGACKALQEGGKSLLPSGILSVSGKFGIGAPVLCKNQENQGFATGLVNYRSTEIEKLCGIQTSEIKNRLGYKDSDEIIHRDNLVLL
jgi:glutamate 5-kinase